MEIETVFYVTIFIMLCSLGAILWMIFSSHISNRNLAIQRDKLHELEIKNLEMEKLKSIASAEEEQMRRIGRFLHDEVGGNMHVLLHMLEKSTNQANPESAEILQRASILTRKSIDSVRSTSQELVPYFLINFGLARTLQSLADESDELPGVRVNYSDSLQWQPEQLPQETIINLYRLAQEIYSNILRHAKPTAISIQLTTSPEALRIGFVHNGVGIGQQEFLNLLQIGKSLGLKNIDYRAKILQADLNYRRSDTQSEVVVSIDTSRFTLHPIAQTN
jgi:signal transduction histidine kinase